MFHNFVLQSRVDSFYTTKLFLNIVNLQKSYF